MQCWNNRLQMETNRFLAEDLSTDELLTVAQHYVSLAMGHFVECAHMNEDDLETLADELQTSFLFPTLSKSERLALCRLRHLGRYLSEDRETNPFGIPARRFNDTISRMSAER